MTKIPQLRLASQWLVGERDTDPAGVVGHLGAVQAQDYGPAKWSLGLRTAGTTDADVERAFNDGAVLRTHILRPTWHFVTPADLGWMQALTAERVHKVNGSMYRKLDLDAKLLRRAHDVIGQAVGRGNYSTRAEIGKALHRRRIAADGQRLGYILMHAELEALVCSGPRRGKQHTYALVEERAPESQVLDRDEALARLAVRYFTGHGPASEYDLAWWSGLTVMDARAAIALAAPGLDTYAVDDRTLWLAPDLKPVSQRKPTVFVVSIYDEYTIAYKDRSDIGDPEDGERMAAMGNALTSVIVIDGKLAGTWKRTLTRTSVDIACEPFGALTAPELRELDAAVERYGTFLDLAARRVG